MKICKIYIWNLEQFKDIELDFTNPKTGAPLAKICLIGRNGTGKSKILRLINGLLNTALFNLKNPQTPLVLLSPDAEARIVYEIDHKQERFLLFFFNHAFEILNISAVEKERKQDILGGLRRLRSLTELNNFPDYKKLISGTRNDDFLNRLIPGNAATDLVIYSPDESDNNGYLSIDDVPQTNVSDALLLFKTLPVFVEVSPRTVNEFWKLLVFNLKKRDDEREKYERSAENINKTKAQLIWEFDKVNPKILDGLAKIWGNILDKAGLEFDSEGANNPIQLTDNLKAYVRLKGSKRIIAYRNLSTGIRNFIFRVGHIYSLYFNRQVERGFLLVDEPENGFFPDFLFDLMDTYEQIVIDKNGNKNTQLFFATHNPIIAAQFEPFERIILDWQDDYSVSAKKGHSPIGDDPNDVLRNDFELKDLMGREGRQKWEEYQNLKKQLNRETDNSRKAQLVREINKIGSSYNFSWDEIS